MKKTLSKKTVSKPLSEEYDGLIGGIAELLEASRRIAARTVNALMTATYWEIGQRIVEFEQRGKKRAEYGEELLQRLAQDLTARFGRGFSYPNVNKFRQFYLAFPAPGILSTPSIESIHTILSTPSIESQRKKGQTSSNPVRRERCDAIAKYALEGLPNKVLAREYKLALPAEKRLAAEIEKTRELLERRIRK